MMIVMRMIAIAMLPVALSSRTRRMKKTWKIGVKSQARRLNGSAFSSAGRQRRWPPVASGSAAGLPPAGETSGAAGCARRHEQRDRGEREQRGERESIQERKVTSGPLVQRTGS